MKKNLNITPAEKKALIEYLSGRQSSRDIEILKNWLSQSEANEKLLLELKEVWHSIDYFKYRQQIDIEKAWKEVQEHMELNSSQQHKLMWLKIAAVFFFAFALGGIAHFYISQKPDSKQPPLTVEYVAPLGSRSFTRMPDGSKIWLNAGTSLTYKNNFGISNREVHLSGEAYFEVAKNPQIPFIVQTSEISIIALGTQFNVKAYAEEKTIETTLVEGSVKLEGNRIKFTEEVILTSKEKAVFTKQYQTVDVINQNQTSTDDEIKPKATPELKIISYLEPEPTISWKEERWIINNEKLGSLSQKLERRYAVNFIFDNELLKDYSFGGTLEDETLEQVLDAICSSSPIEYIIEGKTVYIKSDNRKMKKFNHLLMK